MTTRNIHIAIGEEGSSIAGYIPFKTQYSRNKMQYLIERRELISFGIDDLGTIDSIYLKPFAISSRGLSNFRIRMKEVPVITSVTTGVEVLSDWETEDMVLVYETLKIESADMVVGEWIEFELIEPFPLTGKNLVIEITRQDTSTTNAGGMFMRQGLRSGRSIGWYANSGDFPFDTSPATRYTELPDTMLKFTNKVYTYKTEGSFVSPSISIPEIYTLNWEQIEPPGTNLLVEYTINDGVDWTIAENAMTINPSPQFKVKVTLSTTNENNSPKLIDMWMELKNDPANSLLLEIEDGQEFNNAIGPLTVDFDQIKSDMHGRGGAVEDFNITFTPTDLIPNCLGRQTREYINVDLGMTLDYILIEHVEVQNDNEHINMALSCTLEFINIADIPT